MTATYFVFRLISSVLMNAILYSLLLLHLCRVVGDFLSLNFFSQGSLKSLSVCVGGGQDLLLFEPVKPTETLLGYRNKLDLTLTRTAHMHTHTFNDIRRTLHCSHYMTCLPCSHYVNWVELASISNITCNVRFDISTVWDKELGTQSLTYLGS